MQLRDYQRNVVNELEQYIVERRGNPCVIAPTGSGKSILIATFISELVEAYPGTKVLMLTHQKELIEQDMAKLKVLAPQLEMGVYSASLGEKDASKDITFASIQSIYKRTDLRFDCVIVDECHLINNEEQGMYRTFLSSATNVVIGFTATPYRLGQGMIVGEDTIFTDFIESEDILMLQKRGYLSRLSTKRPKTKLDVEGVGKAMGEFKQKELQEKINVYLTNESVVDETISIMEMDGREHCLVFCTGVEHAYAVSRLFNDKGIYSVCVEGSMSKEEREQMLSEFTSGRAKVITNYGVLTTGFDYPAIDCIVLLRPTLSPGLYLQMLGRGLRIAEGKKNCLVLDFAGNIDRHGPISSVRPPSKKGTNGDGVPPMKVCPKCLEVLPSSTMVCPSCGHEFPVHSPMWHLFNGDVNGDEVKTHLIDSWSWVKGRGKREPFNERYEVTFRTLEGNDIKEYIVFDKNCKPFVIKMNMNKVFKYCTEFGLNFSDYIRKNEPVESADRLDWDSVATDIANAGPPAVLFTRPSRKDPKYTEIIGMMSEETLIKDQNLDFEEQKIKDIYNESRIHS